MLSIIIPLYNAEKYIGNCLNSLVKQDYQDIEIIIVNDGSTDGSKRIVETFIKQYPNIYLYHQENGGIGTARNAAIKKAKGDYLYFIDSDDYIAENVLGTLMAILINNELEILGFKTQNTKLLTLNVSENINDFDLNSKVAAYTGEEFIGNFNYRTEVWWYIVKKDFFKATLLSFYPRKFVQDTYFTPSLFLQAEKIGYVPMDVHRYVRNLESVSNKRTPGHIKKHMYDMGFAIEQLHYLLQKTNHKKCQIRLRNRQQSHVFFLLLRFTHSNMDFKELGKLLTKFNTYGAYPLTGFPGADYQGLKYKTLSTIFNLPSLIRNPFLLMLKKYNSYKK
ncbi:glycosyltransferase [Flagellimonas sp. HMM57]|uniref:glycosyltransferase family 2 protein n=1 Tax=unclassified Flagellimonas TaxID=2644544 RepID=UPI0013D60E30|nr:MULTISPECIES: glycosyltransferase [unclassified Flagellimonas]UII76128.1 glycosyltransferase [Flagellimonas sp. HMM57]